MMHRTGIIGVGLLGSAVAGRWLQAGHQVLAFDLDPDALRRIAAAGAQTADSPDEIWRDCRRVALVLPHSGVSRSVLEPSRPAPGTTVIDMTTGDPDDMARLAAECGDRGVAYLDATVGGSSSQVREGDAIVMIGGGRSAYQECRGLLECFARRLFYLGAAGNGARMKLAMNLVLGLNRAALAEGLAFAQSCGLDGAEALEVFRSGPAYSKAMDAKGEKMLRGDFAPEARLAQHRKDVDLILRQAAIHSARTPLSHLHAQLLREVEDEGHGGEDNSAIIRAFRTRPSA